MSAAAMIRPASPADLDAVLALLAAAALPADGVAEAFADFVVARRGDEVVGAAGIELRDGHALLRSVVVGETARGSGLGSALVAAVLEHAARAGAADVYLLTTTAERWFPRLGFVRTDRAAVPAPLRESIEFHSACPESAAVMVRRAGG